MHSHTTTVAETKTNQPVTHTQLYKELFKSIEEHGSISLLKFIANNSGLLSQLLWSSKLGLFAKTYQARIKEISLSLGRELDDSKSVDLMNQIRELFFEAFFDKDWNFKGSQAYRDMRSSDLLFHILPEIGSYCHIAEIHQWTLNSLNAIKIGKTEDPTKVLSEFCHIFAAIATYRLYREQYSHLHVREAVLNITNSRLTTSDVPGFLNYELDSVQIMLHLSGLMKVIDPLSKAKPLATFVEPRASLTL